MSFMERLALAIRTLAGWLDDRMTIAAIGLATGYFGLGNTTWDSLASLIVALSTFLLIVIPDPRKKQRRLQQQQGASSALPPIELVSTAGSAAGDVDSGLRADPVPPSGGPGPGPADADEKSAGWNG